MKYFIYLLAITMTSCSFIKDHYVQFGEHSNQQNASKGTTRIFYDRYGKIYPNLPVDNLLLKKNYSSLELYYRNNLEILEDNLESYNVTVNEELNDENFQKYFGTLQDVTLKEIVRNLKAIEADEFTFLIHGFRNRFEFANSSYANVENVIKSKTPNTRHHFIEVYWDGLTWTKLNAAKVWDNAQAHSYLVGLELRKVLSSLQKDDINVIAHSTGANVICTALFSQTSKISKKDKSEFQDLYINKLDLEEYKTPSSLIRVALIAPAIPGVSSFKDYAIRNPEIIRENDNYQFTITLNIFDPALTKYNVLGEFGVKTGLGSTSLGCLKSEHDSVKSLFEEEHGKLNIPMFLDFSYTNNNLQQNIHNLRAYVENPSFDDLVARLYTFR